MGKRNARRSVDRTLVKRIVREACRHHAADFEDCAERASARIDVALRLKAPLVNEHGAPLAMTTWRRQVRVEADSLLQEVLAALATRLATTNASPTI